MPSQHSLPDFKLKVHRHYLGVLDRKINDLQDKLAALKEGLQSEQKSSVGDKYETGRAMIHLEQESIGKQLNETLTQQTALKKFKADTICKKVVPGSLIRTEKLCLYISLGLGKALIDGKQVMAISVSSPIGKQLSGLTVGDKVVTKVASIEILEIC